MIDIIRKFAEDRNKVCATFEQVQLLDELDEHLKNGGSLKGFLPTTKTVPLEDISEELLLGVRRLLGRVKYRL